MPKPDRSLWADRLTSTQVRKEWGRFPPVRFRVAECCSSMFQRQNCQTSGCKASGHTASIIGNPFLREEGAAVCGVSSTLPVSDTFRFMSIYRGIQHLRVGEEWVSYSPGSQITDSWYFGWRKIAKIRLRKCLRVDVISEWANLCVLFVPTFKITGLCC